MRAVRVLLVGAIVACAAAQPPTQVESATPGEPAAVEPPVAEGERAEGERLLDKLALRSRRARVIVAAYSQRRTTSLSARPLVSSGEFVFVREPACVVFRAVEPRVAHIRLTPRCYEVYRPERRRLERILLDGPQLAEGLFAALGGDADRLRREFAIVGCRPVAAAEPVAAPAGESAPRRSAIALRPRRVDVGRQLRELVVTVAVDDGTLAGVAYRDASGDLVAIELRELRIDPEVAPPTELELPADVQIVEHQQPRAEPPAAPEPR